MSEQSFLAYCRANLRRPGALGDFCRDWVADRDRIRVHGRHGWHYLHLYLLACEACPEAIDAARAAYREWRAQAARVVP